DRGELILLRLVDEEEGDDLDDEHAEDDGEPQLPAALAGLGDGPALARLLLREQVDANHTRRSLSQRSARPRATTICAARDRSSCSLTYFGSHPRLDSGSSTVTGTRARFSMALHSGARYALPPDTKMRPISCSPLVAR